MGKIEFKKAKRFSNVFRFFCQQDGLYLSMETDKKSGIVQKLSVSDFSQLYDIKFSETYIDRMFFHNDICLFLNNSNSGYLGFSYNDKILKHLSEFDVANRLDISNELLFCVGSIRQREYGVYLIYEAKILWQTNQFQSLDCINNYILGRSKDELYRVCNADGKILWSCSLGSLNPSLSEKNWRATYLGLSGNLLITGIDAIDKLFAIDIETGEIKWEYTTFPDIEMFDSISQKIYSLTAGYTCVDAQTGREIDGFDNRNYFETIGIIGQRNNYAIVDQYLITTDHAKGKIGAFNTQTHQFDWIHEEPGVSFPATKPIRYQAPYLFVHDNKDTLHVFEKIG